MLKLISKSICMFEYINPFSLYSIKLFDIKINVDNSSFMRPIYTYIVII